MTTIPTPRTATDDQIVLLGFVTLTCTDRGAELVSAHPDGWPEACGTAGQADQLADLLRAFAQSQPVSVGRTNLEVTYPVADVATVRVMKAGVFGGRPVTATVTLTSRQGRVLQLTPADAGALADRLASAARAAAASDRRIGVAA